VQIGCQSTARYRKCLLLIIFSDEGQAWILFGGIDRGVCRIIISRISAWDGLQVYKIFHLWDEKMHWGSPIRLTSDFFFGSSSKELS
jgi:hypothetical protein